MLWLAVVGLLACGGGEGRLAPRTDLQDPWGPLALPVGGGEIKKIDDKELHVIYRDVAPGPHIGLTYKKALEARGFEFERAEERGNLHGVYFHRGAQDLEMMLLDQGKRIDVVLELP